MRSKFKWIFTLLVAFTMQFSFAQEKTVTGVVSDELGPAIGATVTVKGTKNVVATDFDGKYSINAKSGDVLEVSYLGMKQTVTVGAANSYNVILKSVELKEVVVTALGVKREKRELVYVTQSVESSQINAVQPTTAASALAGKVAGLQINVQNNGVKPSTQVVLRGYRSISSGNGALIVIDGSVSSQGAFDALNPNDIESINVLKGATAAVVYGSDAGNGALIITTKKGSKGGKFTVGLNSVATFESVAYMPDFQTQYGTGWQGVYDPIENTNWGPRFDGTVRQVGPTFADGSFQELAYAPVKNNRRDFYDTGSTFQNTVYLSGSTDKSSFYFSIGDQKTTGIVPDDKFKRNTFRLNASQTLGKLTLSANAGYYRDETDVVGSSIGSQNRPLYWFILNTPANIPLTSYKNWKTDLYASPDGYYNGYYQNPYWALDTNRDNDKSDRFNGNFTASWDAKSWLNLTLRFGINKNNGFGKNWRAAQTYTGDYTRPDAVSSFVTDNEFSSLQYTTDFLATGNFDLSKDFTLRAMVGASNFTENFRSSSISAVNLSIPGFYDISNGTGELDAAADQSDEKTYGFYSDITLGYKKYLFLNLAGRYDATSTLRAGDNKYFYPGFGLSAVLTDAIPSIKSDILSYAKLSFNNSTVYNDLSAYRINEVYSQGGAFPFGDLNGFNLSNTAVSADIKKEKINTNELGLSLSLLKNRVTLDASYFKTITTDLITNTSTSFASGGSNILTNIGELEGSGVELSLATTVVKTDDWKWNLNVNYSASETVVNEIKDDLKQIAVADYGSAGVYAEVGEVFPQIKATSYVRDPNGNIVINPVTGNPEIGSLKNMGKTTPDYILGLTSILNYKGFALTTTLDYRTGHVYYSQLADAMEFTGLSMESISSNRQDFVVPNSVINVGTSTNPVYVNNTNIPVTGGSQSYWTDHYNLIKENYVYDATALKIRELALSYTLPAEFLKRTPLTKVSFGVVARNLVTWLPKENRFSDPEFNNTGGNSNGVGVGGYFQSPPTRTFGFNLNVEF
jgi:TonB-linked SusC/RagA family outer membrane protein